MVSIHGAPVVLLLTVLLVPGVAAADDAPNPETCIDLGEPEVYLHTCIDQIANLLHWVVYKVEELIP